MSSCWPPINLWYKLSTWIFFFFLLNVVTRMFVGHQSCNKQERTDICTFNKYIRTRITFYNFFVSIDTTQQEYFLRIPRHHTSYVLPHSLVYHLIMFYFVVSKISLLIVYGFVIILTSASLIIFLSGWSNQ